MQSAAGAPSPSPSSEHTDGGGSHGPAVHECRGAIACPYPTAEADAVSVSVLATVLNSPNSTHVDIEFDSIVFPDSSSAAGGHSSEAPLATDQVPTAGSEEEHERAADTPAETQTDGAVVVNIMPAIIGYFSSYFALGICPFFSRIFEAKGFTPYEIGILVASSPFLNMTLLPVLSYLADKFRCETKMVLVSSALTGVFMFAYTLSTERFLVASCFIMMIASRVAIAPLLDQRALMMFPKHGRSSAWSYVRSYAAYGWGIGCFVASLIFSYTASWVAVAGQYMLSQLGLVYFMVVAKPYERIERVPVRFVEVLGLLRANKRLMVFLFASTMMGTGYSFIENFLFLFLGQLGGSETLMGFTIVLTVSTEIPLFQMSARLHEIFTERQMMVIAMSTWIFRVVCYAMLTKAWMVVLIEPLHGITFAFMWLPAMHVVSRAFPPKLSSSATGLLSTLTSGVGPMIGNPIAGTLYSLIGPRKMFLAAALVMTIALFFFLVMDHILERLGVPLLYDPDAPAAAAVTATDIAVTGADGKVSGTGSSSSSSGSGTRAGLSSDPVRSMQVEDVNWGRRMANGASEEKLPL